MEDLGTAIGLGTKMTPDREKPLTQGANTFIRLEMGKAAAAAKAAAAKAKHDEAIAKAMKLTEGKYHSSLQPYAEEIANDFYTKASQSPDFSTANQLYTNSHAKLQDLEVASKRMYDINDYAKTGVLPADVSTAVAKGDQKAILESEEKLDKYGHTISHQNLGNNHDVAFVDVNPNIKHVDLNQAYNNGIALAFGEVPYTLQGTSYQKVLESKKITPEQVKNLSAYLSQDQNIGRTVMQKYEKESDADWAAFKKANPQANDAEKAAERIVLAQKYIEKDLSYKPQTKIGIGGYPLPQGGEGIKLKLTRTYTPAETTTPMSWDLQPDPNGLYPTGINYKDGFTPKHYVAVGKSGNQVSTLTDIAGKKINFTGYFFDDKGNLIGGKGSEWKDTGTFGQDGKSIWNISPEINIPISKENLANISSVHGYSEKEDFLKWLRGKDIKAVSGSGVQAPKNRPAKIDISKLTGVARMKAIQENKNNGY